MREEIKDEARDKKMDICNFYNKISSFLLTVGLLFFIHKK